MSKSLQITIPYVYAVTGVKKHCRNASTTLVRDELVIQLPEAVPGALKVAASWEENERYTEKPYTRKLYHHEGAFWQRHLTSHGAGIPDTVTDLQAFLQRASSREEYGNPFGGHDIALHRMALREIDAVPSLQDLLTQGFKVESSEREQEIERLQDIATRFLVNDGKLYVADEEWCYHTMTFGLGNNHGLGKGTHLCLSPLTSAMHKSRAQSIFPLTDLPGAIVHCTHIATKRGDTNALPVSPDEVVTVVMPEAFQYRNCLKNEAIKDDSPSP